MLVISSHLKLHNRGCTILKFLLQTFSYLSSNGEIQGLILTGMCPDETIEIMPFPLLWDVLLFTLKDLHCLERRKHGLRISLHCKVVNGIRSLQVGVVVSTCLVNIGPYEYIPIQSDCTHNGLVPSLVMRKHVFALCEQQRQRSDQCSGWSAPLCSLLR